MSAEEQPWVFDALVGFLRSPRWQNPIQQFIDQYCIVFSREKESKFSHTQVHAEFRELVDNLLSNHLKELGISEEQFVMILQSDNSAQLKKVVNEYILAMDSFIVFKQMMEKRNIQLELEALKELKRNTQMGQQVYQQVAENHARELQPTQVNLGNQQQPPVQQPQQQPPVQQSQQQPPVQQSQQQPPVQQSQQQPPQQRRDKIELTEEDAIRMAIAASIKDKEIADRKKQMEEAELKAAIAMSLSIQEPKQKVIVKEKVVEVIVEKEVIKEVPIEKEAPKEETKEEKKPTKEENEEKAQSLLRENKIETTNLTESIDHEKSRQEKAMQERMDKAIQERKELARQKVLIKEMKEEREETKQKEIEEKKAIVEEKPKEESEEEKRKRLELEKFKLLQKAHQKKMKES